MIQALNPKYLPKPSESSYTFTGSLHLKPPRIYGLEACNFYLQLIDDDIGLFGSEPRLWDELFDLILPHLDHIAPYSSDASRSKTAEGCLSIIASIDRATSPVHAFKPELRMGLQRFENGHSAKLSLQGAGDFPQPNSALTMPTTLPPDEIGAPGTSVLDPICSFTHHFAIQIRCRRRKPRPYGFQVHQWPRGLISGLKCWTNSRFIIVCNHPINFDMFL